jgi:transcriptional regulator with XRE-family HTH domain
MDKTFYAIERRMMLRLREERLRQKLSYEELSNRSGVHRTSISLIERGKSHPTLILCLRLCGALGIELIDLMRGS